MTVALEKLLVSRDGAVDLGGVSERASMQTWIDLVLAAQQSGALLHTTMPSLSEETISGTLNGIVKNSGPIFALTLARMQVFSQIRFQWTRFRSGEPGDLFGSPELAVLERPWRGGTTADVLARMELDVTAAGSSYIRRVRSRERGEDRLVRLRPEWVTLILGSQEDAEYPAEAPDIELVGFAYTPSYDVSRMKIFEPDEVAQYAPYPDPDFAFVGMSWITPVLRDVLGDNLQTDHKRAFLRNAATPQMVVKFDASVQLEQARKFAEVFKEEHVGAENAWKTLFLMGGADATVIGKDFQQLEFAVTQGKAESRLAAASGVPASWVGFSEGLQGSALNAGNFTSARRRFSDGTMQHLWANAASSLESILVPPSDASLWFVTRGIPFLAMDATDQASVQGREAETIVALVRDGFTPESAVDAVMNRDWSKLVHSGTVSVQQQLLDPNAAPAAGGPAGVNGDAGGAGASGRSTPREIADIVQKLYLGTPDKVIVSQREARELLNRAGADLDVDTEPDSPPEPESEPVVSSNGDGS